MTGTSFRHVTDSVGKRFDVDWDALCERLKTPAVVSDKREAGCVSFATFTNNKRSKDAVEAVSVLGLDYDQDVNLPALVIRYQTRCAFIHTTHSSRWGAYRARVFRPLSRPVTAAEYSHIFSVAAERDERAGYIVDRAASDASRLWFLPAVLPGRIDFLVAQGTGAVVDVDAVLAIKLEPKAPVRAAPVLSQVEIDPSDALRRAEAYVSKCAPAVSGQGGHNVTFMLAQRLVHGFGLNESTAYNLMVEWNMRCRPPWGAGELRRKVREAAEKGRFSPGDFNQKESA